MDEETRIELRRLARAVNKNVRETKAHTEIFKEMNGGIEAIRSLKTILPQLQLLAAHTPRILELAEARADDEAFNRGLKKRLNPLKPFGALIWAGMLGLTTAIVIELVRYKVSGHF